MACVLALLAATGCNGDGEKKARMKRTPPELKLEAAEVPAKPVMGGMVYVPVYSSLFYHDGRSFELTTTVSIRNTDERRSIVIESIRYYDSEGKLLRSEIDKPGKLAPLETASFIVRRSDRAGGPGANYLVKWLADAPVHQPLMEAVMVNVTAGYGLAFSSRGNTVETFGSRAADVAPPTPPLIRDAGSD